MFQQPSGLARLAPWKTKEPKPFVRTLSLKVPTTTNRFDDAQGLICATTDPRTGSLLAANIEETFADAVEEALNTLPTNAPLERTFEAVMKRVNAMLTRLLGTDGLSLSPGEIKGAIVAQHGPDVAAAVWGRPSILLFRQTSPGGPKIFDILKTNPTQGMPQPKADLVGFTNLISGPIGPRDRMLVSNCDLIDLLSEMELLEIMSSPRTDLVTTMLRDSLLSSQEDLNLAILLLDGAASDTSLQPDETDDGRSNKTAAASQPKPLSGAGLADRLKSIRDSKEWTTAKESMSKQGRRFGTETKKYARIGLKWTGRTLVSLKDSVQELIRAVAEQRRQARVKPGSDTPTRRDSNDDDSSRERRGGSESDDSGVGKNGNKPPRGGGLSAARRAWISLDPKSRHLLLISIALLAVVAVSLTGLVWRRQTEKSTANYDKQVASIRQQIDSAEASLIYRDEERARRLLDQALADIDALPDSSTDQSQAKQDLSEEILLKFSDLRRATQLDAPEVLATITLEEENESLSLLADAGNGRLWTATNKGNVYLVKSDGSAESVFSPAETTRPVFLIPAGSNLTLVGYEDGRILAVKSDGSSAEQEISSNDLEISFRKAGTYGSRLYLLDPNHNRIVRLNSGSGNKYGSPEIYVKDGTDLSRAVSMTIDGYIFILHDDGQVTRLLRGKATDFSIGSVEPALDGPTQIFTADADSDLFILTNGRIVRFDKNSGQLVQQYESDEITNQGGLLTNQNNRQLLLINDNRILRFTWVEED